MDIFDFTNDEQKILDIKMALSLIRILYMKNMISRNEYEASIKVVNRKLQKM